MNIQLPASFEELRSNLTPLFKGKVRSNTSTGDGVYCFWWKTEDNEYSLPTGKTALFQGPSVGAKRKKQVEADGFTLVKRGDKHYKQLEGPLMGKSPVPYPLEGYVCLYVGKTAKEGGIDSRIGQHVCKNTFTHEDYLHYPPSKNAPSEQHAYQKTGPDFFKKRNTVSQFRAGMEYLFRNEPEVAREDGKACSYAYKRMMDSIYVSWVDDKNLTFRDRFYLEDLAIGLFHPWFNLDSER